MSDEVTDELLTPGCPQCAVKHLSAALAYLVAEIGRGDVPDVAPYEVYASRALVNLVEAQCGYASHFDFAVGLLVLAEEGAVAYGDADSAGAFRKVRLALVGEPSSRAGAIADLRCRAGHAPTMVPAHIMEAVRELPEVSVDLTMVKSEHYVEEIRREIAKVRARYIDVDFPDGEGKEVNGNGEGQG